MVVARSVVDRTDAGLIERFARGDEAAFARLVEAHWASGWRLARRVAGDDATAEDAVQEAFVRVARGAARFEAGRAFAPWFRAIVVHAAIGEVRARSRRAAREAAVARPEPLCHI
jgi:RNA polymerase sigma-70 factor (ECF subfamily)